MPAEPLPAAKPARCPASSAGETPAATSVQKGRWAERRSLAYLLRRGLRPIIRNYRCRLGEIDLIGRHGGAIVFVEIRYRASAAFLNPKETVDWRKQQRIARVAGHFLRSHPQFAQAPSRFDVVAVTRSNCKLQFEWIQNAFQAEG